MAFGTLLKPLLARLAPSAFVYRGPRNAPARVSLTFDDGPDPRHTRRLLDVLEGAGARGTFFLQGQNAEGHRDLVREIHARGHELGNHGYFHCRARDIGIPAYVAEARRTQALLEECVGAPVAPLFRPPYGEMTPGATLALARAGFRIVHWSLDSRDSFIAGAAELLEYVRGLPVGGGDILLFHEDQPQTLEALPAILDALRARSLGFATVGALAPAR
ncbi:MAG: polysaccharide deacetylase family protein [Betaproteobacteria bacterium]|nr:polysaccharide deacetylase family protein [Betaproteobacteria bacterium]